MESKHQRAYSFAVPAAKRLRHNITDLFSSNLVSAERAQELFNDANAAGDKECRSFVRPRTGKNIARGLQRRLLKNVAWPDPYIATIRYLDPKTNKPTRGPIALMLPSEVLNKAAEVGDIEALYGRHMVDPKTLEHLEMCERACGQRLVGLGIWGDGAPCNWDRTESLEAFTFNIIGIKGYGVRSS